MDDETTDVPNADAPVVGPVPSPAQGVADRPHAVSLVLSSLALLLSLLSLGISWQGVRLSKASSRANVEITDITLDLPHYDLQQLNYDVLKLQRLLNDQTKGTILKGAVTNFGKTRATHVVVTAQVKGWGSNGITSMSISPVTLQLPDMAPGRTQSAYIPLRVTADPAPEHIALFGTVTYTDEATGNANHEEWCYQSAGKTQPVARFDFCTSEF